MSVDIETTKRRHAARLRAQPAAMPEFLDENPAHLIRRLQQIAVAVFLEEMAEFDVTPVQLCALMSIAQSPGIDQFGLSRMIGYDKSTVAGVVERLEAKGLIRRTVSKRDRRARELSITAAGRRVVRDSVGASGRITERLFGGLSAEERPLFHDMLLRLVRTNSPISSTAVNKLLRGRE
jgi:DNA-binding MarR family transcriptional regulator